LNAGGQTGCVQVQIVAWDGIEGCRVKGRSSCR
jgi:hypothetical protein